MSEQPTEYGKDIADEFWRRVAKSDGCWLWTGITDRRSRRGKFWCAGRRVLAHRMAWVLARGTDPGKLLVCHTCDNPSCVRPDHLFLGTQSDNIRDCAAKGRMGAQVKPHTISYGIKNGAAKLTSEKVAAIRSLFGKMTVKDIAAQYGVSPSAIRFIRDGATWKHVT